MVTATGHRTGADHGRPGRPSPQVLAVIPAHDEAAGLAATIASVRAQSRPPDGVLVVADRCTDDTVGVARAHGAMVIETVDNEHRKAGALNQALGHALPSLDDDDVLLIMDADTRLSRPFLEHAVARLERRPELGAVGGVFVGEHAHGLLELAQANEYARYARDIARHRGRVMVLTGTASVLRVAALRSVAAARGHDLPGSPGAYYEPTALTEDNGLTLALKHLGWELVSPRECTVTTELMPTVHDLHLQRLRWYRGAMDNLRSYGWTAVTARYWRQQAGLVLSVLAFTTFLLVVAMDLALGVLSLASPWALVGLGFVAERVTTAWRTRDPRARVVAALLVPEMAYDLLLQLTYVRAGWGSLRGTETTWHHVVPRMAST